MATDSNRRIVWKWESDAFGSTVPQQDPDGDGKQTIVNLRFPGQYYDAESGLHQNWHRTYDPSLGRYISSDPIGLDGGLNTYGYVGQSPLMNTDPSGLCPICAAGLAFLEGLVRQQQRQPPAQVFLGHFGVLVL
ncbi:MAG: RHS repeat-associated core domain-containing protein [Candidatus Thiothrix singaporensis]|uniref:RHS repeat-associated core domain-containing protein n=1 Tax=Candidatus Thiothrix singaporensis TaxID=2799669 RepID=A0A7L6AYY1_9GAMM|nr:MAG: RHS repeat-associated core domain-containing protein [Candidatus Thiothrix singaporensis]